MNKKLLYLVLFFLLALHVLMISMVRLFPFVDLPMHLATATLFRYFGDANNAFSQFYQLVSPFPKTNTLHLLFTSLKIFPSVEFANKVFMMGSLLLLPISIFFLIKKLGGNLWFTLLSFFYIYHYSVFWGFVGFWSGVPIFIFFLIKQYDLLSRSRLSDGIWVLSLLVLLYFSHGLLTIFAIFYFFVSIVWFYGKQFKTMLTKAVYALPVLLLFGYWFLLRKGGEPSGEMSLIPRLLNYYSRFYLPTLKIRSGLLFWDFYNLPSGKGIGIAIALFILGLILFSVLVNRKELKNITRQKPFQFILSFVATTAFVYLFIQSEKGFLLYSFYRFSVFFFLGLIVTGSLIFPTERYQKVYGVFAVGALLHVFIVMNYLTSFQKENSGFSRELLSNIDQDKVLAGAIYSGYFNSIPVYLHFPNYHIVWNKGIALTRMVDFPLPWLVRRNVDRSVMPYCNEWLCHFYNNNGRFKEMPYILIRGPIPQKDVQDYADFQVMAVGKPWALLRKAPADSTQKATE